MHLRYLLLIAALLPAPAFAQATPGPVVRTTTTTISPGANANFSDASYVYKNDFVFDTGAGDYSFTFNFQPGATAIYLTGTGGATVVPGSAPDGTPSVLATTTLTDTRGQGMSIGYDGGASGFLTPGVVGGRYALTFNGGGTNILNNGGTFTSIVRILGDWSATGSHSAAVYDSSYTILDDFTFAGGYTTFSVANTDYQGANPGISFSLLGGQVTPVPEPASWAMMIVGFGVIGAAMRRRRQVIATA